MTELLIRRMRTEDSQHVAHLISSSFSPELHPYLVYCQPGIDAYLRTISDCPAHYSDYALYVCEVGDGQIVGFAEYRSIGSFIAILTYICVAKEARNRGVARGLIARHVHNNPELRSLKVDVFSRHPAALEMYKSMNFTCESTSYWWRRSLPRGEHVGAPLRVRDWHVSEAALERYGFCQMSVEYKGSNVNVGLTSRSAVRVGTVAEILDDDLLTGLRELVPTATAAYVITERRDPPIPGELFVEAHRYSATTSSLGNIVR